MTTRTELRVAQTSESTAGGKARRRGRPRASAGGALKPMSYRWYPPLKSAIDRLLALVLLIPAAPVILLAALLVRLTSRGPAFYTQVRVGLGGRPFTILKLRTMIHKAESLTGPRWSLPGDPRVTPVGAFLRLTHLDELPQLINVLRGDMSLIGPRPERPEFLPELERALPGYRKRLSVRPGVTGLAQVQLPADSDVVGVGRKLAYDLYYIRRLSPWMDLRLLLCTPFYALGVSRERLRRWFRIPPTEEVEQAMHAEIREGVTESRPMRRSA